MTQDRHSIVTLLGAGPVSHGDIEEILLRAPRLVAADGGAAAALAAGAVPERVIGDFDSLPHSVRDILPEGAFLHVAEQESTDFEKCLTRIDAPLILALGFTGGRADHELSVYNALVRVPAPPCIVLGEHDLVFRAPRAFELELQPGHRVSLFPMGPVSGTSSGLRWPIDGLHFAPDGRVGTSNEATGPVSLTFDADCMLVIMPRLALELSIRALLG
ncbi:MAG: thiamine diphosphokinase [Pseudomonadota bacterium]